MVYDDGEGGILYGLAEEFGASILGVVLAHEFGHAIQARVGDLDRGLPTITTEQQADCMAGAWVARAANGEAEGVTFADAEVRTGLIAMITVRDPIGIDQFSPGGHGSAFDRVGAFQVGFTSGPARCAELIDDPLPLVPNTFQPGFESDGNAPFGYAEGRDRRADHQGPQRLLAAGAGGDRAPRCPTLTVVPIASPDEITCAEPAGEFATGAVYCADTQQVFFDEPLARDLYDRFGDFVVGYVLGGAWSEAAQQALGSPLAGEDRSLLSDCLTGTWVADIIPDASGSTPREAARVEPGRSRRGDPDRARCSATPRRPTTSSGAVSRRSPASARVCSVGSTSATPGSTTETVPAAAGPPAVLAALDIGTNSFHLVVARPAGGDRFETLTREKEVVRLGHGGGDMKVMAAEAIDRGIACLRRMRRIVDSYDATLRAVATSAVREAVNAQAFLDRARAEAGVDIEVISGAEEARLIHLGVLQAVPVFDRRILLVDIGGGSTELLIGQRGESLAARSFKVGAVRLTDRFFPGGDVTPRSVADCREYVRGILSHFQRAVDEHGFEIAVASSGTAEADRPRRPRRHRRRTAADVQLLRVHGGRAGRCRRRARRSPHRCQPRQGGGPRAGPGRHHRRRRPDPRRRGRHVPGRAVHVQRGRAARRRARRHGQPDERRGRCPGRRDAAPPPGRVPAQHPPARRALRRRSRPLRARRPPGRRAVRRAGTAARPRLHGPRVPRGRGAARQRRARRRPQQAPPARLLRHPQQRAGRAHRPGDRDRRPDRPLPPQERTEGRASPSSPPSPPPTRRSVRTLAGILRVAIGLDRTPPGTGARLRADIHAKRVVVLAEAAPDADIGLELYAANERKALLEQVIDLRVELERV